MHDSSTTKEYKLWEACYNIFLWKNDVQVVEDSSNFQDSIISKLDYFIFSFFLILLKVFTFIFMIVWIVSGFFTVGLTWSPQIRIWISSQKQALELVTNPKRVTTDKVVELQKLLVEMKQMLDSDLVGEIEEMKEKQNVTSSAVRKY